MSDPTRSPVWQALAAEAGIAADQIGDGVTLLNKATPEYHWTFARAFFPLTIGFERACKLALQVDARLESGQFLDEPAMRKLGHDLSNLIATVESMNMRRGTGVSVPSDPIHVAIITVLKLFATGGRYHHLDRLAGTTREDPVQLWWETVVLPVLARHYTAKRRERDERASQAMGTVMDRYSLVHHAHVDGTSISSMVEGMREGARMEFITPWVRLYVLQIARWLAETMWTLSIASHEKHTAEIPELWEFFAHLNLSDNEMRSRKQWRSPL